MKGMIIEPLKPIITGDHPNIVVHLTSEFGKPLPNQPIIILVDGKRKGDGKTDSNGIAAITLKYKFPAGTYQISALYPGVVSLELPRATAETDMVVEAAKLEIHTIPPTPGVVFVLDGQTYTTDENGVTNVQVDLSGMYTLEMLPIDEDSLPPNVRMEFGRWNDNVFTQKREVHLPRKDRLEAGLTVNYQINQEFYDLLGEKVDPARVSR